MHIEARSISLTFRKTAIIVSGFRRNRKAMNRVQEQPINLSGDSAALAVAHGQVFPIFRFFLLGPAITH